MQQHFGCIYDIQCVIISTGSFLWIGQSRKDLFCVWDQDLQMRPFTIQFPPDVEMLQLSACRDALWGLDHYGRVHIRTLSSSCPTGMHWTLLDLSQLGERILIPLIMALSVNHMPAKFRLAMYYQIQTLNDDKSNWVNLMKLGLIFN